MIAIVSEEALAPLACVCVCVAAARRPVAWRGALCLLMQRMQIFANMVARMCNIRAWQMVLL